MREKKCEPATCLQMYLLCTCMYIYIYTYIHTYIHTYIRAYVHTYIHTYTCIHTRRVGRHQVSKANEHQPAPINNTTTTKMHKSENQTSMTNMARLETQISWISSGNSVFQLFGPRLYESCVVDFWWLECFTIPSATGGGAYERGPGNFPLP